MRPPVKKTSAARDDGRGADEAGGRRPEGRWKSQEGCRRHVAGDDKKPDATVAGPTVLAEALARTP